jgi:Uma2 family endonuclease
MSLPLTSRRLTVEEYLRLDREAPYKSEYYAGEMFAMAGGSALHSRLIARTLIAIGMRLIGRRCQPYDSNLRVGIPSEDLYTFPDVSVFCDPLVFVPGTEDTAMNPTVVIEVLSKSTEGFDRGRKSEMYRQIESLRDYILISQDSPLVERFTRQSDGRWVLNEVKGIQAVFTLETLGIEIPLTEIYEGVEFGVREGGMMRPLQGPSESGDLKK